jgi:hypothetical protein
MRRGAWHQFGDRSQKLVVEQLQSGAGVGVVISVRDLSRDNAIGYAQVYRSHGAEVLLDHQFYNPEFSNRFLQTYPISTYRAGISQLTQISDSDLAGLASELRIDHQDFMGNGLIAPAVTYEAARQDIIDLNKRLFGVAKQVGDELGIPTYATIMLGRSVTSSIQTINTLLSQATSLDSDGWYYGFEFNQGRIPYAKDDVYRCCVAGLTLAGTGKPILHAYAGPMALLSLGFGATGAGIGHSQNLWQFTRGRWDTTTRGGGGDAPPRFFSRTLWGTIIYPDETSLLPSALLSQVLTQSPFSTPTATNGLWSRWDANKHLVNIICSTVADIATDTNPRNNAQEAIQILDGAVALHNAIDSAGLKLRDDTNVYQGNWADAMRDLINNQGDDYDYLDLLS